MYSNNPLSLEESKCNTEQTVANTDPETLHKLARNTKMAVNVFEEVVGIFRISCKAVLQVLPDK
jgi:hypothetical protein